eukprot:7309152-Heterocapsa_arctica.AAC.1
MELQFSGKFENRSYKGLKRPGVQNRRQKGSRLAKLHMDEDNEEEGQDMQWYGFVDKVRNAFQKQSGQGKYDAEVLAQTHRVNCKVGYKRTAHGGNGENFEN